MKMIGGKCGCPDCLRQPVPRLRSGWMSRRNKHGKSYGTGDGNAKHHSKGKRGSKVVRQQ